MPIEARLTLNPDDYTAALENGNLQSRMNLLNQFIQLRTPQNNQY